MFHVHHHTLGIRVIRKEKSTKYRNFNLNSIGTLVQVVTQTLFYHSFSLLTASHGPEQ